jgi:acyl carrier protein
MIAAAEQCVAKIRRIFSDKLFVEVQSVDVDLLDTGVIDSVMIVQLLLELETCFGISLSLVELEIDDFRSVTSISQLVAARMSPQADRVQ